MNGSQWQLLAHGKLLEGENSRVETHGTLLCGHLTVAYYRPLRIRSICCLVGNMKKAGRVELPQDAFRSVLHVNE